MWLSSLADVWLTLGGCAVHRTSELGSQHADNISCGDEPSWSQGEHVVLGVGAVQCFMVLPPRGGRGVK